MYASGLEGLKARLSAFPAGQHRAILDSVKSHDDTSRIGERGVLRANVKGALQRAESAQALLPAGILVWIGVLGLLRFLGAFTGKEGAFMLGGLGILAVVQTNVLSWRLAFRCPRCKSRLSPAEAKFVHESHRCPKCHALYE